MKMTDCLKICKNDFSISIEPMGRHTQNHVPWLSFLAGQKKKTLRSIIFQRFSWWVIGWIQHQDWYSVYLPNSSGARSRNKQRSMKQPATLCSSRQTDSKAPLVAANQSSTEKHPGAQDLTHSCPHTATEVATAISMRFASPALETSRLPKHKIWIHVAVLVGFPSILAFHRLIRSPTSGWSSVALCMAHTSSIQRLLKNSAWNAFTF